MNDRQRCPGSLIELRRVPLLVSIAVCFLVTPVLSAGVVPTESVLATDGRLDLPLTLAYRDWPLDQVLQTIQTKTGVKLSASRDVADDKITLFLDQRPAREVLEQSARHLDFRWYRKGDGYELRQDPAAKKREADARSAAQTSRLAAINGRMELLARLADDDAAQLLHRQNQLAVGLTSENLSAAQRQKLLEERAALQDLSDPYARPFLRVWQLLAPAQSAQLLANGELRLSTGAGTLPAPLKELFVRSEAEEYNRSLAPVTGKTHEPAGAAHDLHVRIHLAEEIPPGSGIYSPGDRLLTLIFQAAMTRAGASDTIRWSPKFEVGAKNATPGGSGNDDPELQRKVDLPLAKLKELGGARVVEIGPTRFVRPKTRVTLAGFIRTLHQVTGLEYVADSYIRARFDASLAATPEGHPKPLAAILDAAAAALDYQWSKEGSVIRFRSRTFFFDRPEEVPNRVLRPWIRQRARGGGQIPEPATDLNELAMLANSLTDAQCRGLGEFWDAYVEGTGIEDHGAGGFVFTYLQALRFWAALNGAQREAALGGAKVPLRALDAIQQQGLIQALSVSGQMEDAMWWSQRDWRAGISPADFAAGSFTLGLQKQEGGSKELPSGGTAFFARWSAHLMLFVGNPPRPAQGVVMSRW